MPVPSRESDAPRARRVDVLGVKVTASTSAGALALFTSWVESRRREYVTFTGVHGVMESQRDPELLEIHNRAGFVACDGMPLVWSCHVAGHATAERVYGPDTLVAMSQIAAQRGFRVFLYGGKPGTAELLGERLSQRCPGLTVVGTCSPPFRDLTPAEIEAENAIINRAQPDIVWVGLSTPKQERWMAARRAALDAPLLCGVGAAFDIHAGLVPQAPRWMQRSGIEWLFRLGTEPRRLWRRYLRANPAFVWRIVHRRPVTC